MQLPKFRDTQVQRFKNGDIFSSPLKSQFIFLLEKSRQKVKLVIRNILLKAWVFCFLKSCDRYLPLRCFNLMAKFQGTCLNFMSCLMLSLSLKYWHHLVFKEWKAAYLFLSLFIVPSTTCSCTVNSQNNHCQIRDLWKLFSNAKFNRISSQFRNANAKG